MTEVVFFVHIPKTAGTSFRKALECQDTFKMFYDYGDKSPETSPELNGGIAPKFADIFHADKINVLCGHVHYRKYAHIVEQQNVLSVLRNPIERLISEYQHLRRHAGFRSSFAEFIHAPLQRNKQSKMLQGVDITAGGLFGITSHYNGFIELVRRSRGWELEQTRLNVAPEADRNDRYALPQDEVDAACQLNHKDLEFFFKITKLFQAQLKQAGINTVPPRGAKFSCSVVDAQKLVGWVANDPGDHFFVILEVNGSRRAVVALDQPRSDVFKQGLSASLHCGFSYPLALLGAKPGDMVGMTLLGAPWCSRKHLLGSEPESFDG